MQGESSRSKVTSGGMDGLITDGCAVKDKVGAGVGAGAGPGGMSVMSAFGEKQALIVSRSSGDSKMNMFPAHAHVMGRTSRLQLLAPQSLVKGFP